MHAKRVAGAFLAMPLLVLACATAIAQEGEDAPEDAAEPTVSLIAPGQGAILYGTVVHVTAVPANATAFDLRFEIDGGIVARDPHDGSLRLDDLPPGRHTVSAVLLDADGREVARSPENAFFLDHEIARWNPTLSILAPARDANVKPDWDTQVRVRVAIRDFYVTRAYVHEAPPNLGEGAIRYTVNGNESILSSATDRHLKMPGYGRHEVVASLVYHDGSPLDPPVEATVRFNVPEPTAANEFVGYLLPGLSPLLAAAAGVATALAVRSGRVPHPERAR